jgi:hypothetical protein
VAVGPATPPRHYFRPVAVTWMMGIPIFPILQDGNSQVHSRALNSNVETNTTD